MVKKKLLEDIKFRPARFYRLPGDVMRDRRFADGERLEILLAWLTDPEAEALRPQIQTAIEELKARIPAQAPGHAAE
jgi:hypothetical protein